MAGIVFFKTTKIEDVVTFYIEVLGCTLWLKQPNIDILRHDNILIGFHQQVKVDHTGLLTFFFETKPQVNEMYYKLNKMGLAYVKPKFNDSYKIYGFYAKDIEGRDLEFQTFLHELPPY